MAQTAQIRRTRKLIRMKRPGAECMVRNESAETGTDPNCGSTVVNLALRHFLERSEESLEVFVVEHGNEILFY